MATSYVSATPAVAIRLPISPEPGAIDISTIARSSPVLP
jgi:hypothetical protein